ncbi:MAG TPA: PAS domain S-box protein [Pyrinomonadaceae bacterium]|jgi:diguanylate cyclase (GGDEF)-like protein/PAS domain S-box-containing protein
MSDKNKRLVKVLSLLENKHSNQTRKATAPEVSEGHFRALFENLPVMFYVVEPHPPFAPMYVSPAFASLGYPLEEWEKNADMWLRVIHPEDCKRILEKTEEAMRAGAETNYEYRIIRRDGGVRWVRDCGRFIRDENGDPLCWQGIILDVTDRKEALDELRESEARYRNLFENASDLIYVHDLAGNYVSVNQAAERVFGISREEALKMNMMQIVAPEHLRLTRKMMAEKIAAGAEQTVYEVVCLAKDGRRVTLEVNSSIIYKNGAPVGVQGIARDITERKQTEEALRESEKRSRDLFENANDLIYTHDLQGCFTSLNRAGEKITGYTRAEVVNTGFNFARVVAPEYLPTARQMTADKLAGKPPTTYELEIIAKDGQRVSLELSTRLILRDGKPIGVQGIARDITERKRAEISLHKMVSLLTSTLESSNEGIVVINFDGEIVVHNKKFLEMWRIPPEVIERKSVPAVLDFIRPQLTDPLRFEQETMQLYEDPLATCLMTVKFKDGRVFERYSQPQFQEGVPVGRVCAFRDITERVRAEERLLHYARHDALTNLPNRPQFMNHLEAAVERSKQEADFRFAVLFLDLDRFKIINDSLGHIVGDKLLMAIAKRLEHCVRPRDVVARLGGDEFTILLNRSGDHGDVVQIAERIQNALSEPFTIDSYEIFTSASIGLIISDEATARQAEDYLRDADTAMYRAKEAGKARYEIFDHAMHVRNMGLLRVENDLRKALERKELRVFYQPIANLQTGEIEEFEALIRWQHPEYGLVEPNEFIGVAEETGLIIPIGKWILEEACRQITVWQNLFPRAKPLSVSVNLSAKQLMHPSLTAQVREILAKTGLKARYLNLEVTETTVMEHSEPALNVLNDFNALGISLSTDDFGTGYSSLSYLHRFPFNRLKIDRSFVNKMDSDAKSGEIVRTIVTLAENLHLGAVAEGIETEEQLRQLQTLGCQFGQGYLFSRPVSVREAEKLLSKGLPFNILRAPRKDSYPLDTDAFFEVAKVQ